MKRNLSPELHLTGNEETDPWNIIPEGEIKTFFCPSSVTHGRTGIFYILMWDSSADRITAIRQMAYTISGNDTVEENIPFRNMNHHQAKLGDPQNVQGYIFK
jgi:hypothetical protein